MCVKEVVIVVISDYYKYYEYLQLFVTRLNCGMKARNSDNQDKGKHCDTVMPHVFDSERSVDALIPGDGRLTELHPH